MNPKSFLPDGGHIDVLWSNRPWTDFKRGRTADKETLAVLPLFGLADWGLGRPIEIEEVLGTAVLERAITALVPKSRQRLTLLPPLRFVLGPYPHTLFGVDFEAAFELLKDIGRSVRAAGFGRLTLFNTSPWNEALVEVAGRELRVEAELEVFAVSLAKLGLDLQPGRSPDRGALQCAACACYGTLPETAAAPAEITLSDFRPANVRQPGPVEFDLELKTAQARGEVLLDDAARRLADLFTAMQADTHGRRGAKKRANPPRQTPSSSKKRRVSR